MSGLKKKINGILKDSKDKLENVQSKPWAPKAAKAMKITGEMVSACDWLPGAGIIAGSLKLGSAILSPQPELSEIHKDMQTSFDSISADLQDINGGLMRTSDWVRDLTYKKGMEMVEARYQSFLDRSHNLKGAMDLMANYMAEFETVVASFYPA